MEPLEPTTGAIKKQRKNVQFDEPSIKLQKECVPGPNVVFKKKALPLYEYITNMKTKGSLGCGSDQYPKYQDGKYCCVDTMSTPQEKFDYINNLLQSALDKLSVESFKSNFKTIEYLLRQRKLLQFSDARLIDNLIVPNQYGDLDDWLEEMLNEHYSKELNRTAEDAEIPNYMYNMKKNIPNVNYNLGGKKSKKTRKSKKSKKTRKSRKSKKSKKTRKSSRAMKR